MTDPTWPEPAEVATWRAGDDAAALAAAQAEIVNFCRWHICPVVTEDLVVDGTGTTVQTLPTLKLTAVNTLTEKRMPFGSALVALVPDVDFEWSENGTLVKNPFAAGCLTSWTPRRRGILANITHGYAALSADVRAVALSVAARSTETSDGVVRVQRGPFMRAWAVGSDGAPIGIPLTDREKDVLRRYQVPL